MFKQLIAAALVLGASLTVQAQVPRDLDASMEKGIAALRKTLPMKVDVLTTLVDVHYRNRTIHYIYNVEADSHELLDIAGEMRKDVTAQNCESRAMRAVMSSGVSLLHSYRDHQGKPAVSFDVVHANCRTGTY